MIIVDTNVVSEFMRDRPDPAVLRWAEGFDATALSICVVTVEEVERGLWRLPTGRRRHDLEQRWHGLVDSFREAIALYDVNAARATARILVDSEAVGRPMALADAQIAGICVANGCPLATRNVSDFEHTGELGLINPFDTTPPPAQR